MTLWILHVEEAFVHQRSIHLVLGCIAAASALACAVAAQSAIVTTGSIGSIGSIGIGPVFSPLGPGDTLLSSTAVRVGSPGVGPLTADRRCRLVSSVVAAVLRQRRHCQGTGRIYGAGTRVELPGNGASNSQVQRRVVGEFGAGQLPVNVGAVLDTRGNQAPCLLAFHHCDIFVGSAAGDTELLGTYHYINFTNGGGRGRTGALVAGVGAAMVFTADAGLIQVGRVPGSASLRIDSDASASGMYCTSVGRDGSFGDVAVDGAGALMRLNGTASARANTSVTNAVLDIGRNGNGLVSVSNGGRIELVAVGVATNGAHLNLGREAASADTFNISGAGSVVSLSSQSVLTGAGPGEAFNPFMRVGRDGNGTLNITGGGKLPIEGRAVSTVADSRSSNLYIGGTGDNANGGKCISSVSGAGAEIRLTGSDTCIGVGPQSFGQLTVANQADVSADGMGVGRSGSVGALAVDNATTYVGRFKRSDGTLILSEASALSTGWLGVGRNETAIGSEAVTPAPCC